MVPPLPSPPPLPPAAGFPSPPAPRRGRLGWLGHLLLLTAWLLASILVWHLRAGSPGHARKPLGSAAAVLAGIGVNAGLFGAVCAAAWACSRATAAQWFLPWRGGAGPLWRGVLYSVGLRLAVAALTLAVAAALIACGVVSPDGLASLRPRIENAVDLRLLVSDRAYFWCVVTLLSASAGCLEEIWRGGMLAGLAGAFPQVFGGPAGRWVAIVPVAILFGLGHLYMGWAAVAGATVLGVGLGAIIVWHRTVWDAAIAHALFDAGSFALLFWVFRHNPHLP